MKAVVGLMLMIPALYMLKRSFDTFGVMGNLPSTWFYICAVFAVWAVVLIVR
jgi:ABC-type long-subunit fatty acid transport system fused permease/ATPase subunit